MRTKVRAAALAVASAAVLCGSLAGAAAGIEPFATWLYPLAWYSTLALLEAAVAARDGRFFLFGRAGFLASALGWSVPFWLFFELLNLRLENWYYVFLPRDTVARWLGITLSFATVIPAILVAERLLDSLGVAKGARLHALRLPSGRLLPALGALMLALALGWPRAFYSLVWGGVFLVVDPWVLSRAPARSLLGDLERGRPGRILRLLAGGLAIGLLWEAFNRSARGKWIYTVPGFEDLKLFEMPLAGFLGFPFFALEAFALWQALVVAGLAVPRGHEAWEKAAQRVPGWVDGATTIAAIAFSTIAIAAMHTKTIASVVPTVADLGAPATPLERLGLDDPWDLARTDPADLATKLGTDPETARVWVQRAGLATLRGIGADGARRLESAGIETVAELGAVEAESLARRLEAAGKPVPPPRVRVWLRAARDAARVERLSPP